VSHATVIWQLSSVPVNDDSRIWSTGGLITGRLGKTTVSTGSYYHRSYMQLSGIWRHVALFITDVPGERIAAIIRVKRNLERGTTLSADVPLTRRFLQETHDVTSQKTAFLQNHRRENLKSYIILSCWAL
jgi:hypothetical protein